MLKLSCNAVDQIHGGAQCRFLGPHKPKPGFARRKDAPPSLLPCISSSASSKRAIVAVVSDRGAGSVGAETGPGRVEPSSMTLADRLRQGSLAEDGKSYRECFIVRSYEVGMNKTATVETIANLLQVTQLEFNSLLHYAGIWDCIGTV